MRTVFFSIGLASICLWSCQNQQLEIPQNQVATVLSQYAKENLETAVVLHTDLGDVELRLFSETPLHRANFVRMIKAGYYKKSHFYRIISSFMVQGGSETKINFKYVIPNEISPNRIHKYGALAMAHYDEGNPNNNSSPTEFYIVRGRRFLNEDLDELRGKYPPDQLKILETLGGAPNLDGKYTVFGEVTKGMEIIEKISEVRTHGEDEPEQKIRFSVELK
jgi:cyclophilin family peptidyl-prolyl cis-trans isomerase